MNDYVLQASTNCASYKMTTMQKLTQEGRPFTLSSGIKKHVTSLKDNSSFLIYNSSENKENLNCKAIDSNGDLIQCRHIGYAFANNQIGSKKHGGYSQIDTVSKMSSNQAFVGNPHDNKFEPGISTDAIYFDLNQFGKALCEIANKVWTEKEDRASKNYLFRSFNHTMAIRVTKRNEAIVIHFYDPNETLNHKRVVFDNLDSVSDLSINDLLTPEKISAYFPEFINAKVGCLLSSEYQQTSEGCTAIDIGSEQTVKSCMAIKYGHHEILEKNRLNELTSCIKEVLNMNIAKLI